MQRRSIPIAVAVLAMVVVASAAVALGASNGPLSVPQIQPAAASTQSAPEPSASSKGAYADVKGGLGSDGIKAVLDQGGKDGANDLQCSVELPAGADPDTCPSWVKPDAASPGAK